MTASEDLSHKFKAVRYAEGEGLVNGVPFSCCRDDSSLPCRHYDLSSKLLAKDDTGDPATIIHGRGCNEEIVAKFVVVLDVFAKMQWGLAIAGEEVDFRPLALPSLSLALSRSLFRSLYAWTVRKYHTLFVNISAILGCRNSFLMQRVDN